MVSDSWQSLPAGTASTRGGIEALDEHLDVTRNKCTGTHSFVVVGGRTALRVVSIRDAAGVTCVDEIRGLTRRRQLW